MAFTFDSDRASACLHGLRINLVLVPLASVVALVKKVMRGSYLPASTEAQALIVCRVGRKIIARSDDCPHPRLLRSPAATASSERLAADDPKQLPERFHGRQSVFMFYWRGLTLLVKLNDNGA